MSGDSPNAFVNENVFDFKDGRSSPAPTTSKDGHQGPSAIVQASVLVEPPKDKEGKEEDKPDFCSPIHNNPSEDKNGRRLSDGDKTLELNDFKHDTDINYKNRKEEDDMLNGDLKRNLCSSNTSNFNDDIEDDACIVNCLYYTMECCRCSII